jgi:molybdopterin-guanine dinucleotide biosynthesis protein A
MMFDAVILAGGRGSRLGGVSKASLMRGQDTLLRIAVAAASGARQIAVVGDVEPDSGYRVTRESPPFAGPVAAISAGLDALSDGPSPLVLVLACDMPDVAQAVQALLAHPPSADGMTGADGVIGTDASGHDQYLVAVYSRRALDQRVSEMRVVDASMRELTRGLSLERIAVPPGSTDDVDTWQDADELGVAKGKKHHVG